MTRKSSDQYENDITRLEQRTALVVSSLEGTQDVDSDLVNAAKTQLKTAFALLRMAKA
jgi:hypothetical protein